jgi:ferredoxin-NADP reductase
MKIIDDFLNQITMYRLVLYNLIFLVAVALLLSLFGKLAYSPASILGTALFLTGISWGVNWIFGRVYKAPTNIESIFISALILTLIMPPIKSGEDLGPMFWAAVWVSASKFIFAIGRKHLFNPVAFSAWLISITLGFSANWWVGSAVMVIPVIIVGLLIVRKIRRYDLVFYFFLSAFFTIIFLSFLNGSDPLSVFQRTLLDSPVLFFAFIMLTEPLTTPPTKILQSIYGALVGFLFAPQLHVGPLFTTPESALLIGNLFSYFVSPKQKLILKLKEKRQLGEDVFDFIFSANQKFSFNPGQYMEWTLGHKIPDSRGNRRYFTLASSPTESEVRLGVKVYPKPSSFKKTLSDLNPGDEIVAGQLAGDFTLPKDPKKKLVFIAGGIGVTPFRSILKFLVDTNQKRDIVVFFSNKNVKEVVYTDIFTEAYRQLGIPTIYTLTDSAPTTWNGEKGRVSPEMIQKYVPDFKQKTYYLSGPHAMVTGFEKTLHQMGIPKSQIKIDFFPGFA